MNKLKQVAGSVNILGKLKRIKDLFVLRLDSSEIKNNSLESSPTHLTDPLKQSNLENNHLLWPWNYTPKQVPNCLPSGRPWPKISIVTPSFNQGEYIEQTIRSVILQGYPNLEYIVVDGASTDDTLKILERYKSDLNVCISEPDEGQTNALNKGFKHATGDILAWLNSDDQYLPDTLFRVAESFDTYSCDVVVGGCQLIQDQDRTIQQTHRCSLPLNKLTQLDYLSMLDFGGDWLKGKFFFQPEVFWSRHVWELSGGSLNENLNFGMDYDFWLRLARQKVVSCHIPEDLAIFRMHKGQKTIFSGNIADYPEYAAISRHYQVLDGIEVLDRERQIVDFPKVDGSGTETIDITATIPDDKFSHRPLILYPTPNGHYYLPFDGTLGAVTRKIRCGKLESPEIIEIAYRDIQPSSTVIDVGTRFGQTTALFAQITGAQGQVLAFESDAYLFHALQKTLAVNHIYNVRPYLGLVGEGNKTSSDTLNSDIEKKEEKTISIDDLNIVTPVSLIKIFANGNESKALQGAVNTISKNKPTIILGGNPQSWSEIVEALGYSIETTLSSNWSILKSNPSQTPYLQTSDKAITSAHQPRLPVGNLCKFLKSRTEVDECTEFLHRNGFASHNLVCKDWDLAHIVSEIGDGNFLDMGSSDSYILKNLTLKNIQGDLYGIDFQEPDVPIPRVKYLKGDLMDTGLPSHHFANISCLSVIEHEVDLERFTSEVSRLLQTGGRLFVTFDYWEPKLISPVRLYGLNWQPLDKEKVCQFIDVCDRQGLKLLHEMDWSLGEAVIHYGYYSPHPTMKYTFGMAVFEKR